MKGGGKKFFSLLFPLESNWIRIKLIVGRRVTFVRLSFRSRLIAGTGQGKLKNCWAARFHGLNVYIYIYIYSASILSQWFFDDLISSALPADPPFDERLAGMKLSRQWRRTTLPQGRITLSSPSRMPDLYGSIRASTKDRIIRFFLFSFFFFPLFSSLYNQKNVPSL